MSNKIRIDTGLVEVEVNDSGEKVSFHADVRFIERFQSLYGRLEEKQILFEARQKELDENTGADENGVPENSAERIALLKDVCLFFEQEIDGLFGAGSCKKALGDAMHPDFYMELLEALAPFISFEREKKLKKYKK